MILKKFPAILLVDDRKGFLGWFIKKHTSGDYCHCCEIINSDWIATQDVWPGYRMDSIKRYHKGKYHLKVWSVKDMTDEQAKKWQALIVNDLLKPWVKKRYDFWGILGHLIGFKKFNNPYLRYCYEIVTDHVQGVFGYKDVATNLNTIFGFKLPAQGSPASLDRAFKDMPEMYVERIKHWD